MAKIVISGGHEIGYECPVCGNEELELGQNYCQICGEGLEWEEEARMKRLTQKDEQGNWCLKGVSWEQLHEGQVITKPLRERLYGALWKLMEYEDTSLAPEDVERVNDFEQYQAGKLLKQLNEEQRKHRWIPVEERLPEEDDIVLVTVSGLYNHITFSDAIQLGILCANGEWFIEGYPEWDNPDVTAWMPLPGPYRLEG